MERKQIVYNIFVLLLLLNVSCLDNSGGSDAQTPSIDGDEALCASAQVHSLFQSGEGSIDSPYIICKPEQLKSLSLNSSYWSDNFRLAAEIDMNGVSFDGIGSYDVDADSGSAFSGVFDGKSYKIKNLLVNHSSSNFAAGFFNYTDSAEIKNLTLEDIEVYAVKYAAGLIGYSLNTEIQNIRITGLVKGETTSSNMIGGLTGKTFINNESKSISNIELDMEIVGFDAVGGLGGWISAENSSSLIVNNFITKGKVDSIPSGGGNTFGGILGIVLSKSGSSVTLSNIQADVNLVLGLDGSGGSFSAVGIGTASCDNASLFMKTIKVTGDITTPAAFNAGFVGGLGGAISDTSCVSAELEGLSYEGNIKIKSLNRGVIGGLIGFMGNYKLKNSYANASIVVTQDGLNSAGGLLGRSGNGAVDIENCHSNTNISASNVGSNIGGLIGHVLAIGSLQIRDSFYNSDSYTINSDALGSYTHSGVSALTNAEMADSNNFSNWDFANIWKIASGMPQHR